MDGKTVFFSTLEIFLWHIETLLTSSDVKNLCEKIKILPVAFFNYTKESTEMFLSSTYQNIPLRDLPVSAKTLRSNNNESNSCKNFTTDMKSIVNFVQSLVENLAAYKNKEADELLKKKLVNLLTLNFLISPKLMFQLNYLLNTKDLTVKLLVSLYRLFLFIHS